MGKGTKRAFTFLKVVILIYGLGVSSLSFLVGLDAARLSFPPVSIPHPQLITAIQTGNPLDLLAYLNRTPGEFLFMMSNNGFFYKFIVPTVIIIHNGSFGKDVGIFIPELLNLTKGPLILPPGGSMYFSIHTPSFNYNNPIFQFIVMPQVWLPNWLGGFKVMEFQINTYTIPFLNFSISM